MNKRHIFAGGVGNVGGDDAQILAVVHRGTRKKLPARLHGRVKNLDKIGIVFERLALGVSVHTADKAVQPRGFVHVERLALQFCRFAKRRICKIRPARRPMVVGTEINVLVGMARQFVIRVNLYNVVAHCTVGDFYPLLLAVGARAVFLRAVELHTRRCKQRKHLDFGDGGGKCVHRLAVIEQFLLVDGIHFHRRVFRHDNIIGRYRIFPDLGRGGGRLGGGFGGLGLCFTARFGRRFGLRLRFGLGLDRCCIGRRKRHRNH